MTISQMHRSQFRTVLLEGIHQTAIDAFGDAGWPVATQTGALVGDALADAIAEAEFVGIRSRTRLTREILERAPKLIGIGAFCIGTNQIDLDFAAKRGIPVFNAPFSNTRSVAELVIAEIIMLMRGIPEKNALQHRGGWMKSAANSWEIRGKTLGIVGYGHIGTQVGVLAEQLGMHVVFQDIEAKLALGNARPFATLDELLAVSDVVSLHVPATPQTANLFGARRIAMMKPGSFLINASRGNVVDIDSLAEALESKRVLGAAIDVFPVEPKSNDDVFTSPLTRFENVLLTPHIGGSTAEAQENIGREVAAKLIRYGNNGSTVSAVNFPEVSLPEHAGQCRIMHIHHNVPGMLAKINERFSAAGINIAAEYLQTTKDIGYVVIDVDAQASRVAVDELGAIDGTIRCRVLC
ncbi:phosphoglycerate dehydrogenase [Aromatoleum sp.]|uniref:phosphoglycerate dehydrogenase n=1 Tax=Aromatoleum sp. TaxID=2307007 RepID=UPI002FC657A5